MKRPKRPTIRDVAEKAGVSIATVSKYVNGQQSFSPAVEEKLREAIEDLGYSQNSLARAMVTGRTTAIGLAVMDLANPHYSNVVKGANRVALANGYYLFVVDMEESIAAVRPLLEALAPRTDGLIVSARIPKDVTDWLAELDKPVAFLGQPERDDVLTVGTDSVQVAALLAQYLVRQRFKRFGYLGYSRAPSNADRIQGLRQILEPAGVELLIFDVDEPTNEAGERAAARVLLRPDRPDVIIGWNDLVATGMMNEARSLGFKVPDDVAFAGIDNIPISRYVTPPLTTVDVCSQATGEVVMKKIIAMIEEKPQPTDLTLEPALIIRESTQRHFT